MIIGSRNGNKSWYFYVYIIKRRTKHLPSTPCDYLTYVVFFNLNIVNLLNEICAKFLFIPDTDER